MRAYRISPWFLAATSNLPFSFTNAYKDPASFIKLSKSRYPKKGDFGNLSGVVLSRGQKLFLNPATGKADSQQCLPSGIKDFQPSSLSLALLRHLKVLRFCARGMINTS
ncbi:hypothetical protein TNIN_437041 [Trichonephila inaurata madagascariensis]|uniref:Uncharacterized protein n=1 Tax=Trichonephila inaurata madagascariensis TaxID=2747483 RepID=A0A8X7CLK4_9ARAC|nr:hypothetical protein TNIN_437041 [Trichonephila inaurata madagascariensis]